MSATAGTSAFQVLVARADGSLEEVPGLRPAARSGRRVVPLEPRELIPLPEGTTLAHLPGRTAVALDGRGAAVGLDGMLPVAAILPVGHLRTLLPASTPASRAPRLPLFGYTAVAVSRGRPMAAALRTDTLDWWDPGLFRSADLAAAVDAARVALPGNRLVDHLAICALEHNCYTAQNTFHRRHEGALPASPACNADCLGCISLQSEGEAPAPQPRMGFAPTPEELADLASYHLAGADAPIVSFGQGCEGEPLTRADALEEATVLIRRRHPDATIHVNTNGSSPRALARLVAAGCNSVRISAISFTDAVFRAYYRPLGYGLDDVVGCGEVMAGAGGQVCLNLLTFPGVTDAPDELERTVRACSRMGVAQVQWRSLNVDHDWLAGRLPEMEPGIGMRAALQALRNRLPTVEHGNFTRPSVHPHTR
ncbi:MAG TPA: radical SAM protein [Candidatus Dormibacteraeota bacterium]|nr:radical SAM protein [Candidatus Dormibacteraeota bacterium]